MGTEARLECKYIVLNCVLFHRLMNVITTRNNLDVGMKKNDRSVRQQRRLVFVQLRSLAYEGSARL